MPNILQLSDNGDIKLNNNLYQVPTLLTYSGSVIKDHSGNVLLDLRDTLNTLKQPIIDYPADNTPDFTGVINAQILSNTDNLTYTTHDYSDWEIATDINFTNVVKSIYRTTSNLTKLSSIGTQPLTTYYVRVRYNVSGILSPWSVPKSYVTPGVVIAEPTVSVDNATATTNILASGFSITGSTETHLSTDWEVSYNRDFTNIVFSSINDTVNLTTIPVNVTLDANHIYYARVKFNTTTYTSPYVITSFLINTRTQQPTATITTTVSEGGVLTGTVTNFNYSNTYNIYAQLGTVKYGNNGTFVYTSPTTAISSTVTDTITIIAKQGTRDNSLPVNIPISITPVTSSADGTINNASFVTNVNSNVGFTL